LQPTQDQAVGLLFERGMHIVQGHGEVEE